MNQLIETLDLYFGKKAPQLPQGLKSFIVKIVPYLAIVTILVMLNGALMFLGLTRLSPAMYFGAYGGSSLWAIFYLVIAVLYCMALPALFKPAPKGWNYAFYAMLVGALQSLLMLNILSLVISLIIGFYFLFQIRPYYFGGAHADMPKGSEAENK